MARSKKAKSQKAKPQGVNILGAEPAVIEPVMTPVEAKPAEVRPPQPQPQTQGGKLYRLLSKHRTASGDLLKPGDISRFTESQARGLVNKIEEVE